MVILLLDLKKKEEENNGHLSRSKNTFRKGSKKMDRAINKETDEIITAWEVGENASYQDKKDCWIAPKDSIYNWDDLDATEIKVHHVSEKRYKNWRGTNIFCSPYFAVYPNSKAKTVQESPQHKMLKNFIYNALKNKDINLIISKQKRKKNELKKVSIKELKDLIDWNSYDIEITSRGYKTLRADVLLPFKQKHELLGYGIDFEIQLQNQTERITYNRSIKWALNGFSVVWLFENDFYFNENKTDIELKNNDLKVFSYSQELYFSGKEFCKNLKKTVIQQSRLLDNKLKEVENKSNKKIKELNTKLINSKEQLEQIYEDLKQQINSFFGYKIKELGENFNEEVSKRVEQNFFDNNKERIKEIINESLIDYLKEIKLNEVIENFADSINYDNLVSEAKNRVYFEVNKKMEGFEIWKEIINNPPTCKDCNTYLLKLIRTKKGNYCYVCENCSKFTSLPLELDTKLRGALNGFED